MWGRKTEDTTSVRGVVIVSSESLSSLRLEAGIPTFPSLRGLGDASDEPVLFASLLIDRDVIESLVLLVRKNQPLIIVQLISHTYH